MSKPPALTAEERATQALAELREVVREAHGLLKDLRAASATAARYLDAQRRFLDSELPEMVDRQITDKVSAAMTTYNAVILKVIEEAEHRVTGRFDRLAQSLLGENDPLEGRSFDDVIHAFADRQQFLEARLLEAAANGRIQPDSIPYSVRTGDKVRPPVIAKRKEGTT